MDVPFSYFKSYVERLEKGEKIKHETRGWNEQRQATVSQRSKEEAQDYRYFPEPDIPPMTFKEEEISEARQNLPELPQQRRARFAQEYGLPAYDIEVLVVNKDLGGYYEQVMSEFLEWIGSENIHVGSDEHKKLNKLAANYIITDLESLITEHGILFTDLKIAAEDFAEYVKMIYQGHITSRVAKDVLQDMFMHGEDPTHIIEQKGLRQVSDESEIEKVVQEIIAANQKAVGDYRNGKTESLKFLVGQVMAKTKGKVNPQIAEEILKKLLG
jgi:aspartyl-tRNA(Asn)/glutamyl-tRNA(Gln) amidotransferase subunit B